MNYLAHAIPFLLEKSLFQYQLPSLPAPLPAGEGTSAGQPLATNPYFIAGTGVPDWLTVVDRRVRVRRQQAERFLQDADPTTAAVAAGVLQHLRDDARFHETRAFAETSLALSAAVRAVIPGDTGFRASFVAHVLVEVLLDWTISLDQPGSLDAYYRLLETVDPAAIQTAVNRMAAQPTDRLATLIFLFCRERILWDYREDDKLLIRLNQVMRRVGFDPLPDKLLGMLPAARAMIQRRRHELLQGIPA